MDDLLDRLRAFARRVRRHHREVADVQGLELSGEQGDLLRLLSQLGRASMNEIVLRSWFPKSDVQRTIAHLLTRKLVAADRGRLALTPEGISAADVASKAAEVERRRLLVGFSESEVQMFERLVERMMRNMSWNDYD